MKTLKGNLLVAEHPMGMGFPINPSWAYPLSAFCTKSSLEVIEKVEETGEPVFITKDGVPITTLYPAQRKPKSIAGVMSRVN